MGVPADGCYEWERREDGKVPHFLHHDDDLLAFAGLYELRPDRDLPEDHPDRRLWTFTILTTTAHDAATETKTGRIKLQLDGAVAGTPTFTCCPACRTATLGYVHVVARYRRIGYGCTLAAAARERVPDYRWSAPLPGRRGRPGLPLPHPVPTGRTSVRPPTTRRQRAMIHTRQPHVAGRLATFCPSRPNVRYCR